MSYDIIGDIHGHSEKLTALLRHMGYRHHLGAWRHPGRTAVFVGDFIDRGPEQLETIHIVREMIDAGSALAVMGNHEFNAIAWSMPDPESEGQHLRLRSDKKPPSARRIPGRDRRQSGAARGTGRMIPDAAAVA